MFLFKKNDKMKRKKLRKILRTHSPDTISNGFPLLYWMFEYPRCVELLLIYGADPNIMIYYDQDYRVTPLYWLENNKKKSHKRTKTLLKEYGGEYIRYSDFIAIDIRE
jgi:hypothetical protein